MAALSRNAKAAYPQRIYEVGSVFERKEEKIVETTRLCALAAHSSVSFSEVKAFLDSY